MKHYTFPCGCTFKIVDETKNLVEFNPDITEIPLDCSRTWDLFASGNTKGVFQLESRFGRQTAKKLKPENIEQLSALVAILRPGCLQAIRDGKSVTEHYIARKNGEEEVDIFHPALRPALEKTYGEMIYQEQSMRIAQDVAWFDLQQADALRKAIGKKKPELMAAVKKDFMAGVERSQVMSLQDAEKVFEWIEKSQRYAFNKSHSVSYAMNAYLTAYAKAHFPRSFYTSYLYFAGEKTKPYVEIAELVQDAKASGIDVLPPDLRKGNTRFKLFGKQIIFGTSDIKGLGEAATIKLANRLKEVEGLLNKEHDKFTWNDILVFISPFVIKTAMQGVIQAGALDYTGVSRTRMLFEYDAYSILNEKESKWILNNYDPKLTLVQLIKKALDIKPGREGFCSTAARHKKLESMYNMLLNPPRNMDDTAAWLSQIEESILGVAITCSPVDGCDTSQANCVVSELNDGFGGIKGVILVAAKIDSIKEVKTKNGKNPGQKMAFLSFSDGTGSYDGAVIFSKGWAEYEGLLSVGNLVLISGKRDKNRDGVVVEKVWQL